MSLTADKCDLASRMATDDVKRKTVDYIWEKHFKKNIGPAFILPSSEPEEAKTALKYGVKPEELYMCDNKVGVIAACARKLDWSKEVKDATKRNRKAMYSSQFFKYLEERRVRLSIAHLDYCSFVSHSEHGTLNEVYAFGRSGIMPDGTVAVNVLKGRERGEDGLDCKDRGRLELVREALNSGLEDSLTASRSYAWLVDSGSYYNPSTTTSMNWMVFKVVPNSRKRNYADQLDDLKNVVGGDWTDKQIIHAALAQSFVNPETLRFYLDTNS